MVLRQECRAGPHLQKPSLVRPGVRPGRGVPGLGAAGVFLGGAGRFPGECTRRRKGLDF